MIAVGDARNVGEKAESQECCSKACDPSDRPELFAGYNCEYYNWINTADRFWTAKTKVRWL